MSPYEIMSIRSFLVNGHGFDLYSYDPGLTVPDGCKLLDASTILPRENVIFYPTDPGKGSVSQFSNTFRYKLLYEKGGWWVDMDVVCQTDRLPSGTYEFGYQDDGNEICTAVIKMPARDDLMHRCLTKAVETGSNAVWGQTGPVLFTHEISKAGLEHHAKSASAYIIRMVGKVQSMRLIRLIQTGSKGFVAAPPSYTCGLRCFAVMR